MNAHLDAGYRRACFRVLAVTLVVMAPTMSSAQQTAGRPSLDTAPGCATSSAKELMRVSDKSISTTGKDEMAAAATLTTKVLAIGTWTAKATPETRPPIMPSEWPVGPISPVRATGALMARAGRRE
jgi:hypothetical protein